MPQSAQVSSLAAGAASIAARAADISGAGATFPYPIYAKWADAYKKLTGVGLNYQSIGSGGGIKQIKAKTVTFGASDMPLKPEDLNAAGLLQFPMIIGGVVPVVNIKGIAPGQLHLDGADHRLHLHGRDHQVGRCRASRSSIPKLALPSDGDRAGLSIGRLGHEFPVLRLPVQGKPQVRVEHRREYVGAMAQGHRREGQ